MANGVEFYDGAESVKGSASPNYSQPKKVSGPIDVPDGIDEGSAISRDSKDSDQVAGQASAGSAIDSPIEE